jgi:hypothetical protein
MRINEDNIREILVDYLDGVLDKQRCKEVEAFLVNHPAIALEFENLNQIRISDIDNVCLDHSFKTSLKKPAIKSTKVINEDNYEEYFVANAENDLDEAQKKDLRFFLSQNSFLKEAFVLTNNSKLIADKQVVYPHKNLLYKKKRQIVPFWLAASVAAAIVMLAYWLYPYNSSTNRIDNLPNYIESKKPAISNLVLTQKAKVLEIGARMLKPVSIDLSLYETETYTKPPELIASIERSEIPISGFLEKNTDVEVLSKDFRGSELFNEKSRSGFEIITSFLWKTTKTQLKNMSNEILNDELNFIADSNLESISGGIISVKMPEKAKE